MQGSSEISPLTLESWKVSIEAFALKKTSGRPFQQHVAAMQAPAASAGYAAVTAAVAPPAPARASPAPAPTPTAPAPAAAPQQNTQPAQPASNSYQNVWACALGSATNVASYAGV